MNELLESVIANADKAVDDFVSTWQQFPALWLQEVDIQVELTERIKRTIPEEFKTVEAKHSLFDQRFGIERTHEFARVTCEPQVKIVGRKYPDIVIWNDPEPGKTLKIDSAESPMLWACEIKYDDRNDKVDFERLILMQNSGILAAGCALRMYLEIRPALEAIKKEIHGSVRYVEAWIPMR